MERQINNNVGRPPTQQVTHTIEQYISQNALTIINLLNEFVVLSSPCLQTENNKQKKNKQTSFIKIFGNKSHQQLPQFIKQKYNNYLQQFPKSKLLKIFSTLVQLFPKQVFDDLEKVIYCIINSVNENDVITNINSQNLKYINLSSTELLNQQGYTVTNAQVIKTKFEVLVKQLIKVIQSDKKGQIQQFVSNIKS